MTVRPSIDLSADAGESFGRWRVGRDQELMPHLTSVSVACGFHAGDPPTMRESIRLAKAAGAALGAHPSLPDLAGFGRRRMEVGDADVIAYCAYQVSALIGMARLEEVPVEHVKLHGALYTMVAEAPRLAAGVARALVQLDPELIFVLPAGAAARAAAVTGIHVATEAYVDIGYDDDGIPIVEDEYAVPDPADVAQRAVDAVMGRGRSVSGAALGIEPDTICLHGDIPNAPENAVAIVGRFEREGIEIAPMRTVVSRRSGHLTRSRETTPMPSARRK